MHVVDVRDTQQRRQRGADQPSLFVGVDRVVAAGQHPAQHGERQQRVERNLGQRGPHVHPAHKRRPQAAEDAQSGQGHVCAERVGDEIDLVPERRQRADTMKLAEGSAARLEKRLGRDHQDAHGSGDFRMKW